jgi:hypothetical protein
MMMVRDSIGPSAPRMREWPWESEMRQMETGDERDGQMEAEPLLGEVIAALQELRAEVIQVRTGGHAESELAEVNLGFRGTFISVLAINSQLETSRVPGFTG